MSTTNLHEIHQREQQEAADEAANRAKDTRVPETFSVIRKRVAAMTEAIPVDKFEYPTLLEERKQWEFIFTNGLNGIITRILYPDNADMLVITLYGHPLKKGGCCQMSFYSACGVTLFRLFGSAVDEPGMLADHDELRPFHDRSGHVIRSARFLIKAEILAKLPTCATLLDEPTN